ncbi:MAG: exodeoxyribonuclease V subunit alpha [Chlamydiae bacterium]|nr:exodeoxyribonuclease V subunit alpha [Chlamydiota bacterium]
MRQIMQKRFPHILPLIEEEGLLDIDAALVLLLLKDYKNASENAAAFLFKLVSAARQGHLCLKIQENKILPSSSELVENAEFARTLDAMADLGVGELPMALIHLPGSDNSPLRPIRQEGPYFYLQKNAFFEERFVFHLLRISSYSLEDPKGPISCSDRLNKEQIKGVETALTCSLSLITGGPGTGKTFTAAQIASVFRSKALDQGKAPPRIVLAAPTGKAASHLEKNVRRELGQEAKLISGTLHMLLSIKSSEDMMKEGMPLHADLIIVDEASMIDARLLSYFLSRIEEGTRVVLMGDKDQLPPIDSGSLFADLVDYCLATGSIPCTQLKESLRSDKKQILDFAEAVNLGDLQGIKEVLEKPGAALARISLFSEGGSITSGYEALWNLCRKKFPVKEDYVLDPSELLQKFDQFRILSCVRKGAFGVDAINAFFRRKYREEIPSNEFFACPILITKNDYTQSLFNGDVGLLIQRKKQKDYVFDRQDTAYFYDKSSPLIRRIPGVMLPSFEYAYCLSVHKSQGSEYDNVLVLVPSNSGSFGKEVLYTAVTRAKSSVIIDASDAMLEKLISRSSRKISGLHARLQLTGGFPCFVAPLSALP